MGLLTYAKAAAPLVPGASRLPFVAGGGSEMPAGLERAREGIVADAGKLADYARVCGFTLRDELPATYPHILAFEDHMGLMTDGRFPFGAIGTVHLANRITVHRPLRVGEPFSLTVRPTPVEPHPKGRTFALVTEAYADGVLVWEETSTMLRKGSGTPAPEGVRHSGARRGQAPSSEKVPGRLRQVEGSAEWRLGGDLGRRYAGVSGDSNPIHLHALTARAFGFPKAIAHGMWTKARCLAALERDLPSAYTVEVQFFKPIFLPGTVEFGSDGDRFVVRRGETIHLEGTVTR